MRYDNMITCIYVGPKDDGTGSQLSMLHGTRKTNKKSNKEDEKQCSEQKKRSSHKVSGVSPGVGRESMVGNICERGKFDSGVKERGSYEW